MKNLICLFMLSLATVATYTANAANAANAINLINAVEIISRANQASYYAADDGKAQARMKIVDAQGNQQIRQFTILRKDHSDDSSQDILVFFSRPTDVKGTVFRVAKKINRDDDRWLYLPALDLVKRISAGDKRTSFVGAHFFYEDVSGRNPKEDSFTLLSTDKDFYTIKGEPKDKNSVEFSHYHAKISKTSFLPMEVIYFNQQGKKTRQMQVLKTKLIDGITTVMHSKISQFSSNGSNNGYTEMQFRKVKYNIGLPDSVFSERSLRNPPKIWLK